VIFRIGSDLKVYVFRNTHGHKNRGWLEKAGERGQKSRKERVRGKERMDAKCAKRCTSGARQKPLLKGELSGPGRLRVFDRKQTRYHI
jgi:hypothetical protein